MGSPSPNTEVREYWQNILVLFSVSAVGEAASFEGEGYMELPGDLYSEHEEQVLEMTVTTTSPDGLIFWQGQEAGRSGHGQDYISISVQEGHAVFR